MISKAITTKVNTLNQLINLHLDADGDKAGVIDTNGTWNAPYIYSITIGLTSVRIDSYDVYANETKVYDSFRFSKSNPYQETYCIETLNDLIKQYRKSLKTIV